MGTPEMLAAIAAKLDKIQDDTTDIKVRLARHEVILEKNTVDLERHIKRTDLLEEKLELHEAVDEKFHGEIEDKLKEHSRPMSVKELAKKLSIWGSVISALAGAAYAVWKMVKGI